MLRLFAWSGRSSEAIDLRVVLRCFGGLSSSWLRWFEQYLNTPLDCTFAYDLHCYTLTKQVRN